MVNIEFNNAIVDLSSSVEAQGEMREVRVYVILRARWDFIQ